MIGALRRLIGFIRIDKIRVFGATSLTEIMSDVDSAYVYKKINHWVWFLLKSEPHIRDQQYQKLM